MKKFLLSFFLFLLSLASAFTITDDWLRSVYTNLFRDESFAEPVGESRELWATYYYVPLFEHDPDGIALRDTDGEKLGVRLSYSDWNRAILEGSFRVVHRGETNTYNFIDERWSYHYNTYQSTYFKQSEYDYGCGVKGNPLIPYRSIAVDSNYIELGTVVFIDQARGKQFVDDHGQLLTHDGYFYAVDIGGRIDGNQIDIFIGYDTNHPFDSWLKSSRYHSFEAVLVDDIRVEGVLAHMHSVTNI